MYLVYRFLTSIIFAMINASIVLYMCQRFFRVMRTHYQIMDEAEKFNTIISESRASLDYITSKISEGMDQMKEDIAKELFITDHLTKLSSKISLLLQRYSELEEGLIELVRMDHNTKSVRIETPIDINEEVKSILTAAKKNKSQQQLQSERPRTPKKLRILTTTSTGAKDFQAQNYTSSKFLVSQLCDIANLSNVTTSERQDRPNTPIYPEVQLLNDSRPGTVDAKPIGFRPTWKCEA